jgi:hypothetical protein
MNAAMLWVFAAPFAGPARERYICRRKRYMPRAGRDLRFEMRFHKR